MPAIVIIGAQWGDEGKGKIVDLLAESADVVVRYGGGPNAGHTLVADGRKIVLRLVPSGALHPHTCLLLGQGMAVSATVLVEEIDALEQRGISVSGRLFVSPQAQLVLPYHLLVDELREAAPSGTKIGTTKRGIGPCYEDKVARRGVRVGDLREPQRLLSRLREALDGWRPTIAALGGEAPDAETIHAGVLALAARIAPLCADVSLRVDSELAAGKRVLLEGAQGTLLDVDHGTYPFVTSSSAVAGGACTGVGIGPTRIARAIGITKAYTTRVGAGPFPTELDDAVGRHLRDMGHEVGSVTGRPRRTGWLDLAALRYARRVNGLDSLALTKLDVLSGLAEVKVGVGYRTLQGATGDLGADLYDAEPIYRSLRGWSAPIDAARTLADLPAAARAYLAFIEEQTELPIDIVSVGPGREHTIVVRDSLPTSRR